MLTGTVLARTSPSWTTGWMSMPVVGVAVISETQSSSPVAASRATMPVDPWTANTRPSATAAPKGPMLNPVAVLDHRSSPVAASTALTEPLPAWA